MKARIKKIAAKGTPPSPVPHRPWQESVDEFDLNLEAVVDQASEEAVVELWLEDPRSFIEGLEQAPSGLTESIVRRAKTGGMGLRRYDPSALVKTAAASSWDQEFADAKAHVNQVLKNLGNG